MFTTQALIRRNNPDLQRELFKLGYGRGLVAADKNTYHNISTLIHRQQYSGALYNMLADEELERKEPRHYENYSWIQGRVDCGEDEELFLAIAALRDDSDACQWFCNNEPDDSKSLFKCLYQTVREHAHEKMNGVDCSSFHKATVEELIKYFNRKVNLNN